LLLFESSLAGNKNLYDTDKKYPSLPPSLPILEKAMLSTSKAVFTQRIT